MVVKILCQSETLIPQIVGFYFTKILQSGEVSLITSNLRKTLFSIEITIPQIAGFNWTKNHANWGICSNNLHSEEYLVFISSSDSSDCMILMHQKTYRVRNFFDFLQSEEHPEHNSVSDSSDWRISMGQKTYRVGNFFIFLQSEEYSEFKSVSDSSDCRISNMIKATKWGSLKNKRLVSKSYSSR